MLIYGCKKCQDEEQKYEVLPLNFIWERDKRDSFGVLECKQCGEIYQLSVLQYIVLYVSLTFVWTVIYLLYDRSSTISSLIAVVLLYVTFPLPFYIVWNELPWKAVGMELPQKEWKAKIGLCLVFILAMATSIFLDFSLKSIQGTGG